MAKVTVIPATINKAQLTKFTSINKRKVAAYARVSTDSDEQFTSFEAQKDYYTKYILANPDWSLVEVYADEGISGTNIKNREGFNKMISDALEGKIDLIVTKSVSRFARNTVDSISTIRKLKEKGVEVYFEKEGIRTLDKTGELMLTIMSSLAQEESRSLSENVKWGTRKSFADGKVHLAYKNFLGFRKGQDGRPEVVPEEAETVKLIYSLFMEGYSLKQIAESLQRRGIETPGHKSKWQYSTIKSILTNEKYKGEAILQKTYIEDFLTHKVVSNDGSVVPKYHVQESHEAIIEPEEWSIVQLEMERREKVGAAYSSSGPIANRIVCEDCNSFYGRKVWHSTDKYKTVIWQCNSKFRNEKKCKTPHLTEEQIQKAFVEAYNILCSEKDQVLKDCESIIELLDNREELEQKLSSLEDDAASINALVEKLVHENSGSIKSQEEFEKEYNRHVKRYEEVAKKIKAIQAQIDRKEKQREQIELFANNYKTQPTILEKWDPRIWMLTIDRVVVTKKRTLVFNFLSGKTIEVGF